jgi:hypothetical protein
MPRVVVPAPTYIACDQINMPAILPVWREYDPGVNNFRCRRQMPDGSGEDEHLRGGKYPTVPAVQLQILAECACAWFGLVNFSGGVVRVHVHNVRMGLLFGAGCGLHD